MQWYTLSHQLPEQVKEHFQTHLKEVMKVYFTVGIRKLKYAPHGSEQNGQCFPLQTRGLNMKIIYKINLFIF